MKHLQPAQVRDYARQCGWTITDTRIDTWLLHNGENDSEGQPMALIIPRTTTTGTQQLLLKGALEVLGGQQGLAGYDIAIEIARLNDVVRATAQRLVNLARRVPAGVLDQLDDCYIVTKHQFDPLKAALAGEPKELPLNGRDEQ